MTVGTRVAVLGYHGVVAMTIKNERVLEKIRDLAGALETDQVSAVEQAVDALSQQVSGSHAERRLVEALELASVIRKTLPEGWRTLVLSSHTEFERAFGRPADKKRKLYNGMIKCDVFMYGNV